MKRDEGLTALDLEEVRRIVNRWSGERFYRVKGLGDKIQVDDVVPCFSYALRLVTQYEDRFVRRASEAYHGGMVDDLGVPPYPWDIPMDRPTDFEERTVEIPVPCTDRVETCPGCGGDGNVTCVHCHGWGKVDCSWCQGRGYRESTQWRTETDAQGNTTSRSETVRESCTCFMGKVTCTSCGGHGKVTCSGCGGSGKVKTFDLLTVKFHHTSLTDVWDTTDVPDQMIGKVAGDTVVDERTARIDRCPEVTPEVNQLADALLQQSHSVAEGASLILFQHLSIERVRVHEIAYRYFDSPVKRLWIYGDEDRVHAPGAPTAWKRLAAMATGALAVVAALISAIAYFSQPPQPHHVPKPIPKMDSAPKVPQEPLTPESPLPSESPAEP